MNIFTASKPLRGLLATAILGALPAGFAAAATAGDLTETRSVTVKFGDLNLSNPQGAAKLYGRIVLAAHEVCYTGDFDLASLRAARECTDKAIADAVVRVGHPELVAVYIAKTHRALPTTVASSR